MEQNSRRDSQDSIVESYLDGEESLVPIGLRWNHRTSRWYNFIATTVPEGQVVS